MRKFESLLIGSAPQPKEPSAFTKATLSKIKNRETISNVVRKTSENTTRRSYVMKLPHLNRVMLTLLIILGVSLVSGTAYAIYQLWLKPEVGVEQSHMDKNGRNQIVFNTSNCSSLMSPAEQKQYETKKGVQQSLDESAKVAFAKCEMAQINDWANTEWLKANPSVDFMDTPAEIQSVNNNMYTLASTYRGQKQVVGNSTANSDTLWIDEGRYATKDRFGVGDSVVAIRHFTYANGKDGAPIKDELLALVKLSLPEKYYSPDFQNSVTEKSSCVGNPDETCAVSKSSIDLYYNPTSLEIEGMEPRSIEGKLVSYDDQGFVIRGSSGKEYRFVTTVNSIKEFNAKRASDYGMRIEAGDSLSVDYFAASASNVAAIPQSQITRIVLVIEVVNKNDPAKKY